MPLRGQQLDLPFLNELLQPICGEPLSGMWRAVGQVFEFGVQKPATNKKGEAITRGDFDLKFIAADWRIVHHGRIILGSSDYADETRFYDSDEPPHGAYNAEARQLAREFFDDVTTAKYVVSSVEVGEHAEVTVLLSDGLVIQSFGSSGEDHDLWWCHNLRSNVSCLVGPSGHNVGPSNNTKR